MCIRDSPISGNEVKKDDVKDVIDYIQALNIGAKVVILIAFKQHTNRDTKEELNILVQKGFSRIVNCEWEIGNEKLQSSTYRIEELIEDEKQLKEVFNNKTKKQKSSNSKLQTCLLYTSRCV